MGIYFVNCVATVAIVTRADSRQSNVVTIHNAREAYYVALICDNMLVKHIITH